MISSFILSSEVLHALPLPSDWKYILLTKYREMQWTKHDTLCSCNFIHEKWWEIWHIFHIIWDNICAKSVTFGPSQGREVLWQLSDNICIISYWAILLNTRWLWYTWIFQDPAAEFWLKLRPGMLLFIDNWRLLHGRSGFTGYRELSGCFLDRDEWLGKLRAQRIIQ